MSLLLWLHSHRCIPYKMPECLMEDFWGSGDEEMAVLTLFRHPCCLMPLGSYRSVFRMGLLFLVRLLWILAFLSRCHLPFPSPRGLASQFHWLPLRCCLSLVVIVSTEITCVALLISHGIHFSLKTPQVPGLILSVSLGVLDIWPRLRASL